MREPPASPPPEAETAVELWARRIAESGHQIAFRYKQDGQWQGVTWAEADAAAREIAAGLCAAGVEPGDRVCLLSQTRLEWMLCDVGILLAGAVTVPIYASNTAEQCAFIVRDAGARLAIVEDAEQLGKLLPLRAELPTLAGLVQIAGAAAPDKPDGYARSLADLRAAGKRRRADEPGELGRRAETLAADSTFTIIYTSGTTGVPEGVVLTHRNLTSALASAVRAMALVPGDEQLLFLPLAHVLARELGWITVQAGVGTWYAESIAKLKDNLLEARPTFMGGVPRVFEKFYSAVQAALAKGSPFKQKLTTWAFDVGARMGDADDEERQPGWWLRLQHLVADALVLSKLRRKLGVDRCRFLISGGAPLAAEIAEFFARAGILILEGYGLTETMAAAYLNTIDQFRFGTVGPALDVVETKIADDGEILMRGPSVFRQYYNDPAATAEAVDAEGWFHSGDIGQLEDGFLRITDRKKDLIVTAGGKKVAPQPIENALKARSPLVGQVLVYGDKRPYCVALVTPSEEATKRFAATGAGSDGALDMPAFRAAIEKDVAAMNAGLAPYERVKAFAVLPVELTEAAGELTPSMKVKRKVVIEKYGSFIEGLYKTAAAAE